MAKFIPSPQAFERINERLREPISRQQFLTIYRLMAEDGVATPVVKNHHGWVLDDELWKWEVYLATRERLIAAGKWVSNRRYSIADMEMIAIDRLHADFQPK